MTSTVRVQRLGICRSLHHSLHRVHADLARNDETAHSTIPAESSITELANSDPARPHHGPKEFAHTLHALLSLLKASSEPFRPRLSEF